MLPRDRETGDDGWEIELLGEGELGSFVDIRTIY